MSKLLTPEKLETIAAGLGGGSELLLDHIQAQAEEIDAWEATGARVNRLRLRAVKSADKAMAQRDEFARAIIENEDAQGDYGGCQFCDDYHWPRKHEKDCAVREAKEVLGDDS